MATISITEEERNLVGKARLEFELYAHVDADFDVSSMPALRRLQVEHHRWQAQKLGVRADTSLAVMTLGIVEEACWELPVAVESDASDEVYDTLGDVLVYTCAACTDLRLDFLTLARNFDANNIEQPQGLDGLMNLFKGVGMLAHVVGKNRQLTRGYDDINKVREHGGAAIARICSAIQWLAFSNDWEASVVFEKVLNRVMKRDWTKNANTGSVVAEA